MRQEGMKALEITCCFAPPDQLPTGLLDKICDLVETCGSVSSTWIRYNIQRSFLVAWASSAAGVVGCSCLKRPRPVYLRQLSERVGIDMRGLLERGYTCVSPGHRGHGIASQLTTGLMSRAGDQLFYTLVNEDDPAIQRIICRNGLIKVRTFYSEKVNRNLGLWLTPSAVQATRVDLREIK
jgi:hypothetical protein